MLYLFRVWQNESMNLWAVVNETIHTVHDSIARTIDEWDSKAQWEKTSDYTWKNHQTGERIEIVKDTML